MDEIKMNGPEIDIGSARFESERKNRTKYLFNLLEKQDDNKEVIIAAGAYAEEKRISEIINEESSLKRLKPKFRW